MTPADLVVIGAGPAGTAAACTAAEAGLAVTLVDEAPAAGGQVYRAPPIELRIGRDAKSADQRAGDHLRAALAASTVDFRSGRRVWSISSRFRVDAIGPAGTETITAPRLVAATGAHERVVPFPGWTLPGVVGLAAATILLKAQAMVPGHRVVVAGCGPLLAAVAAKIVKGGGEVAAIVDLASPIDWFVALPYLAARPSLLAEGVGWIFALGTHRVPVWFRHAIRRAEGDSAVERVVIGAVDELGRPKNGPGWAWDVDCLVVGHGLIPGSEIPWLLRANHRFERLRGGWVPVLDVDGRTSCPGLYAAGDGSGIAGAVPAALSGRLTGLAVARDAGCPSTMCDERTRIALLRERSNAMRFADTMAKLMALRPGQVAAIPSDTVVCRCEDVTRSEIEFAIAAGATEVNQLKHFTRCGMGPCQGRMCGDVVEELLAAHVGSREAAGHWTARPPLRPVTLDAILGDFRYDDIPVPAPAPL
jgi:thioredoxin reductase/bacterioferritin-associated ferredoxin